MERRLHTISPIGILLLISFKLKNCLEVLTVVLCHKMGGYHRHVAPKVLRPEGSQHRTAEVHISLGFTCSPFLSQQSNVVFTV